MNRKEFAELLEKYGSNGSTGSTRNSPIQQGRPTAKPKGFNQPFGSELENYCKGNYYVKSMMCVQFGFNIVAVCSYSVFISDMKDINYLNLEYIVLAQHTCTPTDMYNMQAWGQLVQPPHLFKKVF